MNIIGYTGTILILLSYIFLNTKWFKLFIPVDTFASILLTIHAITLKDIPFIIVNGFIAIMLANKWRKGNI